MSSLGKPQSTLRKDRPHGWNNRKKNDMRGLAKPFLLVIHTTMSELVAVIGSRTKGKEAHQEVGRLVQDRLSKEDGSVILVSGGANTGADYWAKALSMAEGRRYVECPAFWKAGKWPGVNKVAGLFRNETIALISNRVIAFWDYESPGTLHCLKEFKKLGKPVEVIRIRSFIEPVRSVNG